MHLTTLSRDVQSKEWAKIRIERNSIPYVEKGWFSCVDCRVRNWPFRSYCSHMSGWIWIGAVIAFLRQYCIAVSFPRPCGAFLRLSIVEAVQRRDVEMPGSPANSGRVPGIIFDQELSIRHLVIQ
jgi:hypothetical protein